MSRESNDAFDAWAARKGYRPGTWNYIRTAEAWQTALALTGAQPAPAAPSDEVMLNGLTRAETDATASVQGLVDAAPRKQARALPNPGSPEASAMLDSLLAEYQWPANSKNAARAGWEAANRWLAAAPAAQPADSAMEVLRDARLYLENCTEHRIGVPGYEMMVARIYRFLEANDRARALVAKETPHGR